MDRYQAFQATREEFGRCTDPEETGRDDWGFAVLPSPAGRTRPNTLICGRGLGPLRD
jgi:hypothetical protein